MLSHGRQSCRWSLSWRLGPFTGASNMQTAKALGVSRLLFMAVPSRQKGRERGRLKRDPCYRAAGCAASSTSCSWGPTAGWRWWSTRHAHGPRCRAPHRHLFGLLFCPHHATDPYMVLPACRYPLGSATCPGSTTRVDFVAPRTGAPVIGPEQCLQGLGLIPTTTLAWLVSIIQIGGAGAHVPLRPTCIEAHGLLTCICAPRSAFRQRTVCRSNASGLQLHVGPRLCRAQVRATEMQVALYRHMLAGLARLSDAQVHSQTPLRAVSGAMLTNVSNTCKQSPGGCRSWCLHQPVPSRRVDLPTWRHLCRLGVRGSAMCVIECHALRQRSVAPASATGWLC